MTRVYIRGVAREVSALVERLARAEAAARGADGTVDAPGRPAWRQEGFGSLDGYVDAWWASHVPAASRIAAGTLAALRVPSPAMLAAGYVAPDSPPAEGECPGWTAMVDQFAAESGVGAVGGGKGGAP